MYVCRLLGSRQRRRVYNRAPIILTLNDRFRYPTLFSPAVLFFCGPLGQIVRCVCEFYRGEGGLLCFDFVVRKLGALLPLNWDSLLVLSENGSLKSKYCVRNGQEPLLLVVSGMSHSAEYRKYPRNAVSEMSFLRHTGARRSERQQKEMRQQILYGLFAYLP